MKKNLLAVFTLLLLLANSPALKCQGVHFGLRSGLDFQNFNGKDKDGDALDMDMVTRYHFGFFVDIPVATDFYLRSGLLYARKGAKEAFSNNGLDYKAEYTLTYLDMPVNLLYRPTLGQGHLLLGFGPYFAYGIAGQAKYSVNNVERTEKIDYGGDYSNAGSDIAHRFRPFDMGANLFFGYELSNGIGFQLNTQLGMIRINGKNAMNPDSKATINNTGFGFSASYRI